MYKMLTICFTKYLAMRWRSYRIGVVCAQHGASAILQEIYSEYPAGASPLSASW